MSDISEKLLKAGKKGERICRVAYTLNNKQPVLCTIIDEHPLFYMDFEEDFEEEGLFDDANFSGLENEILSLQDEICSFNKFSAESLEGHHKKLNDFLDNKETFLFSETEEDSSNLFLLKETLEKSRLANVYIDFAQKHNVDLVYNTQIEDAHYDRHAGIIFINPTLKIEDQILLTARELRRHWQHRQGALIHPLMFHPDNAILVNRAQVADLTISMIRIAWELQLSGHKEVWERIENSSMEDLSRAFAREAFLDFRTLNNGHAAAAVFECWFLSERCYQQDKILIQQMLSDYRGYVFGLEEAVQNITPALISALGAMPYGKNYLAQHTSIIMEDPIFTDVRDRSNANFLWFIKFERSFRETEQELQISADLSTEADRHSVQHPDQGPSYDHTGKMYTKLADVISLFPDEELLIDEKTGDKTGKSQKHLQPTSDKKRRDRRGNKTKSADIIYFRRGSGQ